MDNNVITIKDEDMALVNGNLIKQFVLIIRKITVIRVCTPNCMGNNLTMYTIIDKKILNKSHTFLLIFFIFIKLIAQINKIDSGKPLKNSSKNDTFNITLLFLIIFLIILHHYYTI
jgi:hypothetical protein